MKEKQQFKMIFLFLLVWIQLILADQIPSSSISLINQCPTGYPYNSQVDFPYRPFPYQKSLMKFSSQMNYTRDISFIDMDIFTYNQTNMDNGGQFLIAVLLKDNENGYQIGLKKTKENPSQPQNLSNYDRYFFETRISLSNANIIPIQIEWSLNTENKLFILGYSSSNNKQLVLLELELNYTQITYSNPVKFLFFINSQNSQNLGLLSDSYQNIIKGSFKVDFACLNNKSESLCYLVYQEDISSLIKIIQVNRSEDQIQRSFDLNQPGLVFDKMQIVYDISAGADGTQKINLVIIANQLQQNSQNSQGILSCIDTLYLIPCKNKITIPQTTQGPIIFSITPKNVTSAFDTTEKSKQCLSQTIRDNCYVPSNCNSKNKQCEYKFYSNCNSANITSGFISQWPAVSPAEQSKMCCQLQEPAQGNYHIDNKCITAPFEITIQHDYFLIKKSILQHKDYDLTDTLILRGKNKKCPKGLGLSCLSFIVQLNTSSKSNKPPNEYLAVKFKLQQFDTDNLATFSVDYASQISDTQMITVDKVKITTVVDITSPLFILGGSGSVGVILYPQNDNTGTYVISSAQIKSSSSTFYKQTKSNNQFLQNLDFKAISYIQQGTKIIPIGIAQDKSTQDSILSIFAPTTDQNYMSVVASSNYLTAYSSQSIQPSQPSFSDDQSSQYSIIITSYTYNSKNYDFTFQTYTYSSQSVNSLNLDVIYPQQSFTDVFYTNTFETLCPYVWSQDTRWNSPLVFNTRVFNTFDESLNAQNFTIQSSHFWYYSIQAQQVYDPLLDTIDFSYVNVSIDYQNDYQMLLSIRVQLCDFVIMEVNEKINIAYAPTSLKEVQQTYAYSQIWMQFHCDQSNQNAPYLKGYKDESITSLKFAIQTSGQPNWNFGLPEPYDDDFGQGSNFTVNFYDILGQDLKNITYTSYALVPPTIFTYPSEEAFGSLQSIITVCDYSKRIRRFVQKCRDYQFKLVIVPKQYKQWFQSLRERQIDQFIKIAIQYNSEQKKKGLAQFLFDFDQKLILENFDKQGNIFINFKNDLIFKNNRKITWIPFDIFNQQSNWTSFSFKMVQLSYDEDYDFEYEDQNYIFLDTQQYLLDQSSNSKIKNFLTTQNKTSNFTYNKIISWNCTWLTTQQINFKIDFLNKSAIDYKRHGIYFVINENYTNYFINRMNGLRIKPNQSLLIYPIPKQYVPVIRKQAIVQQKNNYSDYATAVSIGFAAQIALSQNFQNMWSLVNVCQIISLLLIADIKNWPVKSKQAIGFLNQLSNFDLFGSLVGTILNIFFPSLPINWQKSISPKLNDIGYSDITFSSNLGSFGIILMSLTIISSVIILLAWCITKIERFKDLINLQKLKQKIVILQVSMIFGSYLTILLSSYIQIIYLSFDTFGQIFNSILAIVFLMIAVIIPLLIVQKSFKYYKEKGYQFNSKIRARQNQESTFIQLAIVANYQRNGIKKDEEEQSMKEGGESLQSKDIIQYDQNFQQINHEVSIPKKKKENNQNLQFERSKKQKQQKQRGKFQETTNQIQNLQNKNRSTLVNALLIDNSENGFENIQKMEKVVKRKESKQKDEIKKLSQNEKMAKKTKIKLDAKVDEQNFKEGVFDQIFDQYRPQTQISLLFDVFFALRRLILATFIFYLRNSFFFLSPFLILIIFTSASQIFYLITYKPFLTRAKNNMEEVNEVFLFLICHAFLIYSIEGYLAQIQHDDTYFSEYMEEISFTQAKYDFQGFIFNLTQKLNQFSDEENQKLPNQKISKDQQLLMDVQKIQTNYLDNAIFILILTMVSINIIFMIFDSILSFYRLIIRTLNRNFKLRRCIKNNFIMCCCPKFMRDYWDGYEKGNKDKLNKIIDNLQKQEEKVMLIKEQGPNAYNPVQQLLRKKLSRILNWQDLGLTQQDIDKLSDEQRKKLWELANIKKRQLSAMNDDKNKELILDDKILSKFDPKKDDNNQAFEQDEEIEKKWKKVEQEIEKQKSLALTLERIQSHYQNTLPNVLLNNKEREIKVEKMKQDKEHAKQQRVQTLFRARREQFTLQIQREYEEKRKVEQKRKKDEVKKLFQLNQSLSTSYNQTPRFIESPKFQQEAEKERPRDIENEIVRENIQRGKIVKMIKKDKLKKQEN